MEACMAVYPLIDNPCPYKGRLTEIMDGDVCRMCKRQVHDLTGMADADRRAFLKACRGEVCVSYRVAAGTAVALSAFGIAAVASPPASAQQVDPTQTAMFVVVGGVKDGSKASIIVEDENDKLIPELPVVYEPASKTAAKAADAKPADLKSGERAGSK
jgi:hypothetical protein